MLNEEKNRLANSETTPKPVSKEEYLKNRRGIGICIISRGTVPIKWMMHMNDVKNSIPGGLFWKYIVVERLSWAAARSECVRKCKANNFEWLLFIDDDVFIPRDALAKMLKSGKDIISGMYWTKTETSAPVIFKELGSGPMYDFKPKQIIPIGGSGLGICLIKMEVFDKFDEAGLPYFVENWVHTMPDGTRMRCPIGEDHYFFIKAKELGYQAYCDTELLCDHYEVKKDIFYPGEEMVRELCKKQLMVEGQGEQVKKYEKFARDSEKQTIIFYNDNLPFAGDEIAKRGIGGSEHDIIMLAKEFMQTQKYNVRVYCKCIREGVYDNILYKDNNKMLKELKSLNCDLFISSRNMKPFLEPGFKEKHNVKQTILWGHDLAEDPMWNDFEIALPNIDKVVLLTNFHKDNVQNKFPFLKEEQIIILRNGVDHNRYKDEVSKVPGRCIYSSTPYRGLDILLKVWPEIKKRVPHAELYIFSSIKVYGEWFDDSPYEALYNIARNMPGVKYHGAVKQDRLGVEQMKAELLLYPNTFQETCCNTAMECQTAGTPIISSAKGALTETVKSGCGVLITGEPNGQEYQEAFINAAVDLLSNKEKWSEMSKECAKHDFTWKTISEEWQEIFLSKKQEQPIISKDETYKKELQQHQFRVDHAKFGFLKDFVKEKSKVLVANCGLGALPRFLKASFPEAEIWGSEKSMFALDYNRQSDKTIFFANHPIENPDYEAEYFDTIICQEEIDPKLLGTLKRIIKPDGNIILSLPSKDWPTARIIELCKPLNINVALHFIENTIKAEILVVLKSESNINTKKNNS